MEQKEARDLSGISGQITSVRQYVIDAEWRIFQEWYKVCPDEPFEIYFPSTIKRATLSQGRIKYDLSKINIVIKYKQ